MIQKLNHLIFYSIIFFFASALIVYFQRKDLLRFILSIKVKAFEYKNPDYSRSLLYRFYQPKNNLNHLPLVLYLHGAGQRGNDNKKQLDRVATYFTSSKTQNKYPSFFLAPQCPLARTWTLNNDKPFEHYNQSDYEESEEIKLTIQLIKYLQKTYQIDENRIYVIGYSMGGTAVWDIITRHPDIFAAAIPISGASDTSTAAIISNNTSVWAFHGGKDHIYPTSLSKDMDYLINKVGGSCKFTVYEDVEHNGMIREVLLNKSLNVWLFDQQKKSK